MTRRERVAVIAAIVALPIAILLVVLAVDAQDAGLDRGGRHALPERPAARLRALEGARTSGDPRGLRTLDLEDDLAYRRALALFKRLRPGEADQLSDPEKENRWAELQFDLMTESRENPDAERRSELQNLMGVVLLARYLYASPDQRSELLTNSIGAFRSAIELDSRNDDAKVNLELALRAYGPILFPSDAPDTGGARVSSPARDAQEAGTEAWASAS